MATKLQISRTNETPSQFARCELCLLRQRTHFKVGHFPGHSLCVRCGLYLEMFPTQFISPAVHIKKPKNTLAKLLCKSALISAIPLSLHALGASTTAMIASIPFVTLSAMAFCDEVVLNDAIDFALYVIKRPLRVLASKFYVPISDVVTELFNRYITKTAGDIDQVSLNINSVNWEVRQIKVRQQRCDDRFLDDLGLDHLPRTLVRDALKELVQEQFKKNKLRRERSNEASGDPKDEAIVSLPTEERENDAMDLSFEGSERSDGSDDFIIM